ncbi:protein NLRC3-like isoform X2 [Lates japonicus]|uniref:Protein NLRC3-like isoform X2 n=1 Tax=Lates japonicus TaxID=270547 RepID=A0AAD3MMJ3_LATJO|nr:protein NLRC3-like isoform X2 [Lates japonicus]
MVRCEDRRSHKNPLCGNMRQTKAQRGKKQQERPDSPEPSCLSMKSDRSMGRLINFKDDQPADGRVQQQSSEVLMISLPSSISQTWTPC